MAGTATAKAKTGVKGKSKVGVKDGRRTTGPAKRAEAQQKPEARTNVSSKAAAQGKIQPPKWNVMQRAAQLFKQIGDPTRLAILCILKDGERHVGAICEALGQSQPAVSHHLALLKHAEVVRSRRAGKNNFYMLNNAALGKIISQSADLAASRRSGDD